MDSLALGLGRLNVSSALGETLKAEIDISNLSAEEASSLVVRIAGPDAYRAAGVDYNAVLQGAQVTLARRADGRPYLRVRSDRAVQEPFVDVILELAWSSGKLVREFTLLFDPPNNRIAPQIQANAPAPRAPAPAAAPPSPVAAPPTAPVAVAAARPTPTPAPRPETKAEAAARPVREVAVRRPAVTREVDTYQVRKGDYLSRIAARTQRPGVELDQMLVGLYRANPDAFIRGNMNRLKSGVVLSVPAADVVKSIPGTEARGIIQAQSADFGAYRRRLAGNVPAAVTDGPARVDRGKVTAAVSDKQPPVSTSADKLKLSGPASRGDSPESRLSRSAEVKENAARAAELTRNMDELKRLQQGASAVQVNAQAKVPTTAASAALSSVAAAQTVAAVASRPVLVAAAPVPAVAQPRFPQRRR